MKEDMMAESKPLLHKPPGGGKAIFGFKLEPGDVIQENDVYDSSSGGWDKAPCPGLELQSGIKTVWIRPVTEE